MKLTFLGLILLSLTVFNRQKLEIEPVFDPDEFVLKTQFEDNVIKQSSCPEDMVPVEGDYCPNVDQKCTRWLDSDLSPSANSGIGPLRCAEFEYSKCLSKTKVHKKFCMDTYEWPNKKGEYPDVGISWYEAKKSCESFGKRLCTESEWTFACEGEDIKPYPYGDGYHRDAMMCNIDKPSMDPSLPRSEWHKHYRAVPSGSMESCVSPFGVYDMTGNVDEAAVNESGKPYMSALKGGYWSTVRTRCRPATTVHGPEFVFYQNGFRCCKDQ